MRQPLLTGNPLAVHPTVENGHRATRGRKADTFVRAAGKVEASIVSVAAILPSLERLTFITDGMQPDGESGSWYP